MKILLMSACIVLGGLSFSCQARTPMETVQKTVEEVLEVLRDGTLNEEARREEVTQLISRRFDFPGMSQRILATNWRDARLEQKKDFIELFRQLLGNTYWKRIRNYRNERVEVVSESIKGNQAKVLTLIQGADKAIPVDYKLREKQGRWMAYDVIIEQVSLVRNYQVSFQNIVKKDGMDALLNEMRLKLQQPDAAED